MRATLLAIYFVFSVTLFCYRHLGNLAITVRLEYARSCWLGLYRIREALFYLVEDDSAHYHDDNRYQYAVA